MTRDPTLTEGLTPSGTAKLSLKLAVVAGPDFGRELVLEVGTYKVGKDQDSHLVLADPSVSRTHLLVEVLPSAVRFIDNGSKNGSFFRSSRFTSVDVGPGGVVRIGRTELKVLPAEESAPALAPSTRNAFGRLVGRSAVMREAFARMERVAATQSTVLIRGETGTGKELCARALHDAGARRDKPYVVCDLAAATPTLIEAELFGHKKGAFTGADDDRAGVFERANGGTLFLDELGELPIELQPRLLRALESGEVKRVGEDTYLKVDVRVVAATHRDLAAWVTQGRFREDLFHRVAVTLIELPPLRERPEDIALLVDAFLGEMSLELDTLSEETRALLMGYGWPGNVRELRNMVERMAQLGDSATVLYQDAPSSSVMPFKEAKERLVSAFERDYLVNLLKRSDGNVSRAAERAGITRVYVHMLLKKHNITGYK